MVVRAPCPAAKPGRTAESSEGTRTSEGWRAKLELAFGCRGDTSHVRRRRHSGPLVMQRAFREPDGGCQVYLLHPPGGVAGGDELRLEAEVDPGARALITTPAATKLYRTKTAPSRQEQYLLVGPRGHLEWLPQETIVYQGACSSTHTQVELAETAQFCGWEILCLGQDNCGLRSGEMIQHWSMSRQGAPLWDERARLTAGDPILSAPWGLNGHTVLGTFAITGCKDGLAQSLKSTLDSAPKSRDEDKVAVTQLGEVILIRYLGNSSEAAREHFVRAWQLARPHQSNRKAHLPRVWST